VTVFSFPCFRRLIASTSTHLPVRRLGVVRGSLRANEETPNSLIIHIGSKISEDGPFPDLKKV